MLLLEQMLVLFILMLVGYFCFKKKIITEEVNGKISSIVVNVANPALILSGALAENRVQGKKLIMVFVLVAGIYVVLVGLAQLMPAVLRADRKSAGVYKAMTIFSNIGFMGFPLIDALYGKEALLYGAFFMIPYNLLIYTYGISLMRFEKAGTQTRQKPSLGRVMNAGVIACIVTMVIYLAGVSVPSFLAAAVTHLSNLTAPLSMMVIGASLALIDIKKLFTDIRLLVFSALKLLVIPVAGMLIIRQFVKDDIICGVCMVMLATPVGSMTAMLARQYEGDYEMASKGVALTSVLAVLTMPIVAWLAG